MGPQRWFTYPKFFLSFFFGAQRKLHFLNTFFFGALEMVTYQNIKISSRIFLWGPRDGYYPKIRMSSNIFLWGPRDCYLSKHMVTYPNTFLGSQRWLTYSEIKISSNDFLWGPEISSSVVTFKGFASCVTQDNLNANYDVI